MCICIRKAEISDAQDIQLLFFELMGLHASNMPKIFTHETTVDIEEIVKDISEYEYFYVVTLDSKVIGYMKGTYKKIEKSLFVKERDMIMLTDLIIKEGYRDQGIGKEMLSFIEAEAKKRNIDSVELPVYSFNRRARTFYENNGYVSYVERRVKEVSKNN